MFIKHT